MADEMIKDYKTKYASLCQESNVDLTANSILRLIVILGTKCSLMCRDCNNLIPRFKHQKDLSAERIIRSLHLILDKVDFVDRLELIGGEPFLSKNLEIVLGAVIGCKNINKIEITTNGTVLPSSSLLPLLQNPKVNIEISDYKALVEPDKLIKFCDDHDIRHKVLSINEWVDSGDVQARGKSFAELSVQYQNCISSYYCKTLFEDKLFQCARASSLFALGFCTDEKNYLVIDSNITAEKLLDFIYNGVNPSCDHCDSATGEEKKITPAIQME